MVAMAELTFYDEIQKNPVDLTRAALRFARAIAYPELDVELYANLIGGLGDWAIKTVTQVHTPRRLAGELSSFLFDQLEFRGNIENYEDPRNSFLNEVFDRRLGIPITLSAIYITVARSAGLKADGIGLPGHFVVRIFDPEGDFFVDPFNAGKILSVEGCAQLVASTTGYLGPFQEAWLEPAPTQTILTRMLNNLRNIYMKEQDWEHALGVIEHLSLLQPGMHELVRDRGIIYHQKGKLKLAVQSYEKYLELVPDAPDAEAVTVHLRTAARMLARMN
jgi:regulator of sirC expression with transglutaminase-like and TPR domain